LNRACGIVVTFNPEPNVEGNLRQLFSQLEWLVVVDNGSRPETLTPIREASIQLGFTLIEVGQNRGIAAALNLGVKWALNREAEWVALFDQDSTAEGGLIDAMLNSYQRAADRRIAIVSAKHLMRDTKTWMKPVFAADGGPLVAITSGSLMPMFLFDECGLFEEDLIIDRVDEEYCLRVRTLGYTITLCEEGVLWVTLGSPRPFKVFGRTLFSATNYSPGRRYYNTRNRLIIVKRYWRLYPRWCYLCLRGFVKEALIVVIAEQQRILKLKRIVLGIHDALMSKMGMVVPL
jgi:rhamnosyltransferase